MDKLYLQRQVMANAVWIDPAGAGTITDGGAHSVIVSADGNSAFLFSDRPKSLVVTKPRRFSRDRRSRAGEFSIRRVYKAVYSTLEKFPSRPAAGRPREASLDFRRPIELPKFHDSARERDLIGPLDHLISAYLNMSLLYLARR